MAPKLGDKAVPGTEMFGDNSKMATLSHMISGICLLAVVTGMCPLLCICIQLAYIEPPESRES